MMRVRVENLVAERFSQIEDDVRFRLAMDNIVGQVRREASEAFVASVTRNANPYLSVLATGDTTRSNFATLDTLMNGFRQSDDFAATIGVPNSSSSGWPSLQPQGVSPGYNPYYASSPARSGTDTPGGNPFRRETVPSQPTTTSYQPVTGNLNEQFWPQPQETINSSLFATQSMALDFNDASDNLVDGL
jgi:hypothetical protein